MKVSIIIPAYNCERYIEKCLDSVLSQKNIEPDIIVVNDGSTDSTGEILKKYQDEIRIVTTVNRGISAARNEAMGLIRGEYTMFIDADDYLQEGAFERLAEVIEETGADIVKFRYRLVFPDGSVKTAHNQFDKYEVVEKKDFKKKIYPYFIKGIRLNSTCVGIYRSSLIKGRRFREDMAVAEDAVFSLGTYTLADKVAIIPDVLYNYYQTGTGLTGSGVSLANKYKCNFVFARETSKLLKEWDMNNLFVRIKVYLRPFVLTFDKLFRILGSKQ